jgi:peptide/nickel transport system substrate-binding protein
MSVVRLRRGGWLFLLLLAGGVAAFSLVWYAASKETGGSQPAYGGTYTEGLIGAPSRVNPLFAEQNAADSALVSLLFSGLTRLDDKAQPFPDLAAGWDVSPDGMIYTFHLRDGLVWQDGEPLTADDVVFTYKLLESPDLRSPPDLAQVLSAATVTKADALTVRIELAQPFAPLPAYLGFGVLPKHVLENVPVGALYDDPFNVRPMGAGPYHLESLSQDRALLVANPAYQLGQPYVQHLELRFYRDSGALMAGLKDGHVDGAFFPSGVNSGDYAYLQSRKNLSLYALSSGEVSFLYFNLEDPLFTDRRVRQALAYAIDRDGLVQEAAGAPSLRADSPLAEGTWAYSPAFERYSFDPTVAAALLDEAGWRLNASGLRSNGSRTLSFSLATNNDPSRVALANSIATRWRSLGVVAKVEAGGTTTLVRDLLEPRAYQAALFAYSASQDPDPYPAWHSSQTGPDGRNISLLSDPRFDRLLEEARRTPDQARRSGLYGQFQQLFADEVPAIPLFSSVSLYVQRSSVKGARPGYLDNPGARFWQVQDWYVKTK